MVNFSEQEAKDRLWRRETDRVGRGGHHVRPTKPGRNTLFIDRYEDFGGLDVVFATRFAPTIALLTPGRLAELAIKSALLERNGRDGITYLIEAKRNGITTPLSPDYEKEILRRTQARDLHEALNKIRGEAGMGRRLNR